MNKILNNDIIYVMLFIVIFLTLSASFLFLPKNECDDKECIEAKIRYETIQAEIREKEQKRIQEFELEKLKIQADIERNKPIEVKIKELEKSENNDINDNLESSSDSLNYLETSQKVRDVIDITAIWYWAYKILTE